MVVFHSATISTVEGIGRTSTSKLDFAEMSYRKNKMRHVGGTFVERLAVGDRVAIAYQYHSDNNFVYSGEGGGPLTFRGELLAVSNMGA